MPDPSPDFFPPSLGLERQRFFSSPYRPDIAHNVDNVALNILKTPPSPITTPNPFFRHLAECEVFFRILNFRHLADYQNNFRSSVGKFVIWLPVDFFVKKQRFFRQKAALPYVYIPYINRLALDLFGNCQETSIEFQAHESQAKFQRNFICIDYLNIANSQASIRET